MQRAVVRLEMTAFERESVGREQTADDLHGLFERVDSISECREGDASFAMLLVEPPRRTASSYRPPTRGRS